MSGRRRSRGSHSGLITPLTVAKQWNTIDMNILGTKNHVCRLSARRGMKEQTPSQIKGFWILQMRLCYIVAYWLRICRSFCFCQSCCHCSVFWYILIFNLAICYIWIIALHGAETWTLWRVDQKYLRLLKCAAGEGWRSAEPFMWELKSVTESRRGKEHPASIKRRTTDWICQSLRRRCILKEVFAEKIEWKMQVRKDDEVKVSCYWMKLRKGKLLETEKESLDWKRLWTCLKHTT
jgi:hypothetical protein